MPTLTELLNSYPHHCYNQALQFARDGDLEQAKARLQTAVTLAPAMVDAHVVLGKVHAQTGHYEEAIACWQKVLQLDPDNTTALGGLRKAHELSSKAVGFRLEKRFLYPLIAVILLIGGAALSQTYVTVSRLLEPSPMEAIRSALRSSPFLAGADLRVIEERGVVQLAGTVNTPEQLEVARAIALRQAGDRSLDFSTIAVKYPHPAAESFNRLVNGLESEGIAGVTATQKQQTLCLTGEVASPAQKEQLETLARSLTGVQSVDSSGLIVAQAAMDSIMAKIRNALKETQALSWSKLNVQGKAEIIQLTGQVATAEQKELAFALVATKANGIPVDVSRLEVLHPTPLAESYVRLLHRLEDPDREVVQVKEDAGVIYLSGTVKRDADKSRLEGLAQTLAPARAVDVSGLRSLGAREVVLGAGNTLWGVASTFYGSGAKWVEILKQNPQLPEDPSKVRAGTRITIIPKESGN